MPASLFFPVTPFDASLRVDLGVLREHVERHLQWPVSGVFAGAGTGEYASLSATEVGDVVRVTRDCVAADIDVYGAAGGPLGHALECARRSADSGASALLVLPPALTADSEDGQVRYLEAVLTATGLPALLYNRPEAPISVRVVRRLLDLPQFRGCKDGVGDVNVVAGYLSVTDDSDRSPLVVINGLPLAELRVDDYERLAVQQYTSSAFTMAPDLASRFAQARSAGDERTTSSLLSTFFKPLEQLRRAAPGQGLSLTKAAVRLAGCPVGPVRPPLDDLDDDATRQLAGILERARAAVDTGP